MKKYTRQIIKWTLIGLGIRLLLMPFTMHGQDLCFINYFPMMFVEKGIWDPYGFINTNFAHFPYTYYGPVLFIIMSGANFIFIKIFHFMSLVKMLEISGAMLFTNLATVDYVKTFSNAGLFRNLFLMKCPYLVFDFLIGGILLKLTTGDSQSLTTYKLWMLNIITLQSVYAVGGFGVIPVFFIVAALYAAWRRRPYLCIILLSLGGATKLYPYILIPPSALLLGDNWRKRLSLVLTAVFVSIPLYLPFYLSSGGAIYRFFKLSRVVHYSGVAGWLLPGVFLVLYAYISLNALKDSRHKNPEAQLLYYFIITLFLSYTVAPIRFRYFISVTPFLAIIIPRYKKLGIFTLFAILMLAFQWLTERDLQLGLFAPLNPQYFLNLPTLQEMAGRFFNIEILYRVISRALPLSFLGGACYVWFIKISKKRLPVMAK